MMFFGVADSTFILVLIGVVISLIASSKVRSTFHKYSKVASRSGLTGAEAADRILQREGIYDVNIQHVSGDLTDHYNPIKKTLSLSDATYASKSVAAIGVAAHECGHAIQHAKGYAPLKFRSTLAPIASFGSSISWFLILAGLFINNSSSQLLINAGIIAFSLAVLFQLITLPVEFNASSRAMAILERDGMLYGEEVRQSRKVLSAAAWTYVAAAAASILQLLRLILISRRRR